MDLIVTLGIRIECHYAVLRFYYCYAERHYAECRYVCELC